MNPKNEQFLSISTTPLRFNDTSLAVSVPGAEKANKPSRKTLQGGLPYSQICQKAFEIKGLAASFNGGAQASLYGLSSPSESEPSEAGPIRKRRKSRESSSSGACAAAKHSRDFRRGGGGGCRTPVRKRLSRNFSVRRRLLRPEGPFPSPEASRHACGSGSFMMHGARKA